MNVFFVIETKEGETELITAPLTHGDILPGVTRRSLLELVRSSSTPGDDHPSTLLLFRHVLRAS